MDNAASARLEIGPACATDFSRLAEIERAAGAPFRDIGMAAIADDAPPSAADFAQALASGGLFVGRVGRGTESEIAAYLWCRDIVRGVFVEQVSVDPRWARRRYGRALMTFVQQRARNAHQAAMWLTTFTDVPWNAPYYARIGFVSVDEADCPRTVRDAIADERARGLHRWPRCAMRCVI